jgi:hypothetical protein
MTARKSSKPPRHARPPPGFWLDDVAPCIERWRAFAQAYAGEAATRFARLASQLEQMIVDGRCTFTTPVQTVRLKTFAEQAEAELVAITKAARKPPKR